MEFRIMSDRYAIDGQKLAYHPKRVAEWLDAGADWSKAKTVYPLYVEVSPVGACNQRCRFCDVDYLGYKSIRLDARLFEMRLAEMAELGVKSIMYAGEGEPLLHKDMVRIVKATHHVGIDSSFTTNGTVMRQDFIEEALPLTTWLRVSINAGTPGTYSKIHQSTPDDFKNVVGNLKQAVKFRNDNKLGCTIGAQMVLLPENAKEIEQLALVCRDEIGLDYLVIKPYSHNILSKTKIYENIDYLPYLTLEKKIKGLNSNTFKIVFRKKAMNKNRESNELRYKKCHATPFFWAYIMADGSVYGCSAFLMDDRFKFGNINLATFQEIWEGERRMKNVMFMDYEFDASECRKNCRMDEVNRYLDGLQDNRISHINFI